jgi:hypothetical protein
MHGLRNSRVTGVSDGAGGIFLTWQDCRDCASGSDAIYAIRLGPGAAPRPGWPVSGVAIVTSTDTVDLPAIVATGDGAAMIAWLETGAAPDAYVARRVEANGTFGLAWQSGGRVFAKSTDILTGWPLVAPDGDGGAMFAFRRGGLDHERGDAAGRVGVRDVSAPAEPRVGVVLIRSHDARCRSGPGGSARFGGPAIGGTTRRGSRRRHQRAAVGRA